MSTTDPIETPAESLTRQIVERLIAEGLISKYSAHELQSKLATGKLRAEDWRLLVELSSHKERKQ
ncbi:MAG: hypothetical protein SH847_27215 [Roseiflexaceae bacterium]|nr:hypothetical protein [Roseiflexaceae bacterium]